MIPLLVACASEPPPAPPAPVVPVAQEPTVDAKVTRAVQLAEAVKSSPAGAADAGLASKNGSREELEGLLYEIAADPTLTEQYAAGMGR